MTKIVELRPYGGWTNLADIILSNEHIARRKIAVNVAICLQIRLHHRHLDLYSIESEQFTHHSVGDIGTHVEELRQSQCFTRRALQVVNQCTVWHQLQNDENGKSNGADGIELDEIRMLDRLQASRSERTNMLECIVPPS